VHRHRQRALRVHVSVFRIINDGVSIISLRSSSLPFGLNVTPQDYLRGRNQLIGVARAARSLMIAKGDVLQAHAFAAAKPWQNDSPEVESILQKAATAPLSTASDYAALWLPVGKKLCEALRPLTVFGRLQPLMRRVPFRTRVILSSDTTEARFVGEAKTAAGSAATSIPAAALSFTQNGEIDTANMNYATIALISVFTNELVRTGPVGSDQFIAGELLRGLIAGLDKQFVDPGRLYDAAREAPASITSAGTVLNSTGTTLSAIDTDLGLMVGALDSAGMNMSSAHWIMSPVTGAYLARLRGTSGAPAFPDVGALGGTLLGLPVLTSAACNAGGSPGERFICLVEAAEVTYADDDGASVEFSSQASLEMSDTPTGTATTLRALWQNDLTAVMVKRYVNWQSRTGAAAVLRNVNY
jgi:Phage capsid family